MVNCASMKASYEEVPQPNNRASTCLYFAFCSPLRYHAFVRDRRAPRNVSTRPARASAYA